MSWEEVGAGYTELKDLSGGLNASNEYIDDNQSMDCKNVYGKDKALHKMYGAVGYPEDPVSNGEAVTGIYQYHTDSGGDYIIATAGAYIKRKSGDSWVNVTGTATVTANTKVQFATFNNKLVGTDGVNAPWAIDGTGSAADLGGSPPKGKYIAVYRGFLVLGNCTVAATPYPQRAYRSGLWSQTSWNTTDDYWNFGTSSATELTGLCPQQSRLLGLKKDSIGLVMGASAETFAFYPEAYPGIGCSSGYAIGNGTFYLKGEKIVGAIFPGLDGFYLIPEASPPFPVSPTIAPHYRQLSHANIGNAVGGYYSSQKQYLFFAPSGLSGDNPNDAGYLIDTDAGGTWPIADIKATCCAVVRDPTDKHEYFLIGLSNGKILKFDPPIKGVSFGSWEVDGGGLANHWKSNWFDMGDSTQVKLLRELLFYINATGDNSLSVILELRNAKRTKTYTGTFTPGDSTGEYPFAYPAPYARAGLQIVDGGGHRPFRYLRIKISQSGKWGWSMQKIGMRMMNLGQRRVA